MPELPDVDLYVSCLERLLRGQALQGIRLKSSFLLRTVEPPLEALEGSKVLGARRIGKRVVLEFESKLFLIMHLMVAGRLRWGKQGAALPGRIGLVAFDFAPGSLLFTEAGSKKRASMHVVQGERALREHDPGGIEPLEMGLQEFHERMHNVPHNIKRALCDPHLLSGIGNAYSDEILHHARLSPFKRCAQLKEEEVERLWRSIVTVLNTWSTRLAQQAGDSFPTKVTAFRPEMAVHGRFGMPCPVCQAPIQRIAYKDNETNYCAGCQTNGRLLKDRVLSRLLKDGWPRSLDEL